MSVIVREKVIDFVFESKMPDIGKFTGKFKLKRSTPKLDTQYINVKSALTGGVPPLTRSEMILIDCIATLTVFIEPLDAMGNPSNATAWVDDILDKEILMSLYDKWTEFQNSFYSNAKESETTF